MPDFQAQNILFGSSFDSTAFVAGINKSIDGLKNLSTEQKKLQSTFDSTKAKLSENQTALEATQKAYDALDKGSKSYIESQNKLKAKIDELKTGSTQLNETLNKQKAALESFNATNAAAIASFNKLGVAQQTLRQNSEKPIVPIIDPVKITGQMQAISDKMFKVAGGKFDFSGFEQLQSELLKAGTDVEKLNVVLTEAKQKLTGLAPGTQEFNELNQVIETGEKFIGSYNTTVKELGKTQDVTGEKTLSMRSRIKALREELTRLEDAGLENTEQFKKTQLAAARLTDQFQDQQQQIKVLSSDTKALDFGLAAINAAGAGMQVFLGVVNLLGLSEEDAAEAQRKLLAVMNLVQGAQQLQNLLLKEGTIRTLGAAAASRAYAVVNGFLTTSFGAAATAATALRGVLITTGIGALVVGLGFLVAKLVQMQQESAKAAAKQKLLNDTLEEAKGEYTKAVVEVDTFKEHLRLAKEGVIDKTEVLKEYNDGLGKTMGAVEDLDAAERKVAEGGAAYIQFTLLKAAANIALGKAAEKAFEVQQETQKKLKEFATTGTEILTNITLGGTGIGSFQQTQEQIAKNQEDFAKQRKADAIKEKADAQKELTDLVKSLNDQAAELAKQFHFDFIPKVKIDKEKVKKEVENVFKAQLLAMQAQLAEINKAAFISADTIAAKVQADYEKAKQQILDFFKKKQLTKEERDILLNLLGIIKEAQLTKDMAEFTKNVLAARKKLQDELDNLSFTQSARNIANIQDSFERESRQITLENDRQTAELIRANDEQIAAIKENIFLNEDEKNAAISQHNRILNDTLLAQQVKFGNDQRDLALEFLEKSLDDITRVFDERSLRTNELEQKSVKTITEQYINGEITFKTYQDGLTKIQNDAQEVRKKSEVDEIEKKIRALQELVNRGTITTKTGATEKLNAEQLQQLRDRILALQKQLNDLLKGKGIEPPDTSGLDKALAAYQSFTQGVLGFIEQINQAEQDRLNRSIALQQTRVENARFIAEKGNAEYLELEQKRLDALIAKREAAANKELAINNALAASNAIVAAISAIAKSGDVITGLAAAVAVLAAIGSIYKFVNSLQPPVAEFAEGTMYVQRGRYRQGKDTIPARLTEGEAIIPRDTNKAYNQSIAAIYKHSIPASVLNEFVAQYPVTRIPQIDYGRLHVATERSYQSQAISTAKIEELLTALNENIAAQEPVKMTIDQEGFTTTYMKLINKRKRLLRS
jgi:hypothetical protein